MTGKSLIASLFVMLASACSAAPTQTVVVTLHGARFSAETATNEAARERGLMARPRLPNDHGMLFVFPDSAPRGFWMKNTLVALDILYFDHDRRLVSTQHDVPPCKADPCPIYPSASPAQYVLELPAGTARRIDATRGDVLAIDGAVGTVR